MKPKLIIVRGIPGSGKTTYASLLLESGFADSMIEADKFFEDADGKYVFDANRLGYAHMCCKNNTKALLQDGLRVIVSNTSTTWKEISPYIQMAFDFGADVEIVEVRGNFGSIHDVPTEAIERMKGRWASQEDIATRVKEIYADAIHIQYRAVDNN